MITKDMADAIKTRRTQLGKTQREMSERLGKSHAYWGLIESCSDQVDPDIEEVARALQCDMMDLMSGAITPIAGSAHATSVNGNGKQRAKPGRRKEAPAPAENSGGGGPIPPAEPTFGNPISVTLTVMNEAHASWAIRMLFDENLMLRERLAALEGSVS